MRRRNYRTACNSERQLAWDKGAGFSRPVRTPAVRGLDGAWTRAPLFQFDGSGGRLSRKLIDRGGYQRTVAGLFRRRLGGTGFEVRGAEKAGFVC